MPNWRKTYRKEESSKPKCIVDLRSFEKQQAVRKDTDRAAPIRSRITELEALIKTTKADITRLRNRNAELHPKSETLKAEISKLREDFQAKEVDNKDLYELVHGVGKV